MKAAGSGNPMMIFRTALTNTATIEIIQTAWKILDSRENVPGVPPNAVQIFLKRLMTLTINQLGENVLN
jgi:hypothetical protein